MTKFVSLADSERVSMVFVGGLADRVYHQNELLHNYTGDLDDASLMNLMSGSESRGTGAASPSRMMNDLEQAQAGVAAPTFTPLSTVNPSLVFLSQPSTPATVPVVQTSTDPSGKGSTHDGTAEGTPSIRLSAHDRVERYTEGIPTDRPSFNPVFDGSDTLSDPPDTEDEAVITTSSFKPKGKRKRLSSQGGSSKRAKSERPIPVIEVGDQGAFVVERSEDPDVPSKLTLLVSDGSASKWPTRDPTYEPQDKLTDDYKITEKDDPMSRNWKLWAIRVGTGVAGLLGLTSPDAVNEWWTMTDWPAGYRMYNKPRPNTDGKKGDLYLYGSHKFRSPNEILGHFHWLAKQNGKDQIACECKYCSGKKSQVDVNRSIWQDKLVPSVEIVKAPRPQIGKRVERAPKGPALILSLYRGPYVDKQRDIDLGPDAPLYRRGELVWVAIEEIIDPENPNLKISFWPGLAAERILKASATRVAVEDRPKPGRPPRLEIQQTYHWNVKLLATKDTLLRQELDLLPYLAYSPPSNLFTVDATHPRSIIHVWDFEENEVRRPSVFDFQGSVLEAIAAFALSVQIARRFVSFWSTHNPFQLPTQSAPSSTPLDGEGVVNFQGIWWGSELIWCGEMVRLLTEKDDLPGGVFPPSPSSEERCYFIKIGAIYKDVRNYGMVSGDIYELASGLSQGEKGEDDLSGVRYVPQAPPGYHFRCLTPRDGEHTMDIQHLAGRYYPPSAYELPEEGDVDRAVDEEGIVGLEDSRAYALAGLTPGKVIFSDCERPCSDRREAFKIARDKAEEEMSAFFGLPSKAVSFAIESGQR